LAVGGFTPASNLTEEFTRTHSGSPYLLTKKIKVQE